LKQTGVEEVEGILMNKFCELYNELRCRIKCYEQPVGRTATILLLMK
jgi:hypothetical protein